MIPRKRQLLAAAVGLFAAIFAAAPASAQADILPYPAVVEGIPVGKVYLKPFVGLGSSWETNPLYEPDLANPQADLVTRANVAFGAMLPFKNSYVRFSYDGIYRWYAKTQVPTPNSRDVVVELSLRFSTFDRFVAHIDRTNGAAEVLRFDGGEKTYNGTPFSYYIYTVGAERDTAGHFGYQVAAAWSSLNFDSSDFSFFEFKGYDATLDLHFPLSPTLWLVGGAAVRRYDHFKSDTGLLFRKEQADDLRGGVRGVLAGNRNYHAILAWDRANYPGGAGSNFAGLVGDASIDLRTSPEMTVTAFAVRRRWSSFYGDNNYYLANTIGATILHRWPSWSEVGGNVGIGNSAYPDPYSIAAGGTPRRDRDVNAMAYGIFAFSRLYGLRAWYSLHYRFSNDPTVVYNTQTLGVQFVVGWR